MTSAEQQQLYTSWRTVQYYPRIMAIEEMGRFILGWDSGVDSEDREGATKADRKALTGAAVVMFSELTEDLLSGMLVEVEESEKARMALNHA